MPPLPLALLVLALLAAIPAPAQELPWFRRSLVGLEIGPTGAQFGSSDPTDARYAARFDGQEIVRRCLEAHGQYLVFWARDGDYAYYDSGFLPKPPGLGGRNPLRDAVQAARPHALPVIAYCVVQQNGLYLDAHPELAMRDAAGNPIPRFCLNSGYLEHMKRILDEQLAHGVDGFHIDMLDQGFGPPYGCWCARCQQLFHQQHGKPMPAGVTWDADWDAMLEFRYRSSAAFEQALEEYLKERAPGISVDFNYHGNPPFSWETGQRPVQHGVTGDFVTGETGAWGFSALTVALNAEFYRAARPGAPFQVVMQRGVRMYHDQTTRPLHDIRWELFTLLSHGAFVTMVDKTAFDGGLDPVAYERTGAAFAEALAEREHFGHQPVVEAGLYFSARTRDWIGREDPGPYFQSFQGAHKTCAYEHIGFGVLLDEDLTLEKLRQFPVVCLPGVAIVSEEEARLFRTYVEEGGNLLILGETAQRDQLGNPASPSPLRDLVGAEATGRLDSLDNWVRLPAEGGSLDLAAGIRPDWPFLVKGPAVIYRSTGAVAAGELLRPHRTTRQLEGAMSTEWPMSPDTPAGPAALLNHFGNGKVLTLAASPDAAAAGEHHTVEARRWLRNAIRFLHPEPRVRITAPVHVEAVVTDDPASRTLRVHLLCYAAPPQTTPARNRPFVLPALLEDRPLFRASVELRDPPREVFAVDPRTAVRLSGRSVEATVEDVHDTLVLRY